MAKQLMVKDRRGQMFLPGMTLSKVGAIPNKGLTKAQWEEAGDMLSHIHQTTLWWIGDWLTVGESRKWVHDDKYEGVKERFGIGYRTGRQAVWVSRAIEMSRRRDKLSWSHHQEVAPLTEPEQDHWLDLAEENGWSLRDLRKAIKAALPPPDLGEVEPGKFRVILADPPWDYSDSREDFVQYSGALDHYPTVATDKLCEMDVADKAASNSVLFLWATSPMLTDAFEVMEAWGFEYKAQFIWDKVKHNYGHYNSVRHELLLIGTRGSCPPQDKKLHDSVQSIERGEHSAKPDEFYGIIEAMYPSGPYIELFARRKRRRWKSWGNEANGSSD